MRMRNMSLCARRCRRCEPFRGSGVCLYRPGLKIAQRRKFRVYCQNFNEVVTVAQMELCSFHKDAEFSENGVLFISSSQLGFTILVSVAASGSRHQKYIKRSERFYIMAVYLNSSREIRIGDRVRGIGTFVGRRLQGLTGRVACIDYMGYDVGVEWECDGFNGHNLNGRILSDRGLYVYARHLEYIGEGDVSDATLDDAPRCYNCNGLIDSAVKLGSRLYKDNPMCPRCIKRKIGTVHGYHFGKNLRYNISRGITLGVEVEIDGSYDLECDARDELARECIDYAVENNYALVTTYETDGSLCDGGVECVSVPLTLDEWRSAEVRAQYEYLFERADEYGFDFSSDNNAGLHVHIGRKDLCGDDRDISDAVGLLMGWAVSRLWDRGFSELAGRDETDYCHNLAGYNNGNGLNDTSARYDRYYFVNIQNSKTIELRVFNRATSYEDVLVAVDTCYMLGKWATKKINAFLKRGSYSAKAKDFTDALAYADRITWDALVKYSKFPELTLPRMRKAGINV